eukprot:CAMPEP_0204837752 /NCGR_PEP_ID=MMETSP1346-20131115/28893_1 /ASSEMBLY_ACC=CAM_ASM_000771 /TAXON_ID=215587 /ORGANISM="Aplanochytrium stocchinoi, Strain GSBS06" /LENGTH=89 /DNA_ID=CAMNT_0051973403 /DNA_START=240 /DNA_END=506 /DNA_ORIENTATION=-
MSSASASKGKKTTKLKNMLSTKRWGKKKVSKFDENYHSFTLKPKANDGTGTGGRETSGSESSYYSRGSEASSTLRQVSGGIPKTSSMLR